jgi:NAD-dependent SIR2 family protein deacetylase
MNPRDPRPEHREIDPHDEGVIDLRGPGPAYTKLRCVDCRPHLTTPVRYRDDPETICRCAQCGKRHSTDSLEVTSGD